MEMTRRLCIFLTSLLLSVSLLKAQEDSTAILVREDSTHAEMIDFPEGMMISKEELMRDFDNRTRLTEGVQDASVQPMIQPADDQLMIERLSRIPTTIEMPLNNVTKTFINTYCNGMRHSVSVMLGASNFYMPIFEEALERYGLPLELKYLPVIESALRPSATSHAGAAGLWQFMIATGKRYGLEVNTLVDERCDPLKSSEAAAHYLSDLFNMFGDWGLAIAAYNCGENNVHKALLRAGGQDKAKDYWDIYNLLPRETRGYLPAFIAATYIMNYYCDYGIVPMESTLPTMSDTIVVAHDLTFSQIAGVCNVTIDELRSLNPQYRRDIVPRDYAIRLPAQSVEPFILHEDSLYAGRSGSSDMMIRRTVTEDIVESANTTTSHRSHSTRSSNGSRSRKNRNQSKSVTVKGGDSLSKIASRNGTTVANLRKLNGISGSNIRPGQKIRVK